MLDVGSGIGGALLTTLTLFERLRAMGVEIVSAIAAEVRRRPGGDRRHLPRTAAGGLPLMQELVAPVSTEENETRLDPLFYWQLTLH
jgi:hypothetical protein